ncbi:hypothetical protein [Deinococcus ruber]|uniref:Uncharacterized protein n=1 Tax=Deinococcus ruber TaxID=1848197 RepID=A0A918CJJ0_9DEIO|nr:hypothetical protein [Deinococcus ruber]GGR26269.1 hypothetical protein GCM10008957_42270 [Deinococcus ruber]
MIELRQTREKNPFPLWLLYAIGGVILALGVAVLSMSSDNERVSTESTSLVNADPALMRRLCEDQIRPLVPEHVAFAAPVARWSGSHWVVVGRAVEDSYTCDVTGMNATQLNATAVLLP